MAFPKRNFENWPAEKRSISCEPSRQVPYYFNESRADQVGKIGRFFDVDMVSGCPLLAYLRVLYNERSRLLEAKYLGIGTQP